MPTVAFFPEILKFVASYFYGKEIMLPRVKWESLSKVECLFAIAIS